MARYWVVKKDHTRRNVVFLSVVGFLLVFAVMILSQLR